jgi:hypothetical protein
MAPTTMRAGYSGVLIPGSAITGTRQPGPARHLIVAVYVAEPPGRQVLTVLRASLGTGAQPQTPSGMPTACAR